MPIDDLQKAIAEVVSEAVAEAYARGFQEGREATLASILNAAQQATTQFARADCVAVTHSDSDHIDTVTIIQAKHHDSRGKRAPRGLTGKVLKHVLGHGLALPMEEIQRRATEFDSRVSPKTVYNELYREKDYYKDSNGRWRLVPTGVMLDRNASQLTLTDAPTERGGQEAPIAH